MKFLTSQQKQSNEQKSSSLTPKGLKSKKHHVLQLIVQSILDGRDA